MAAKDASSNWIPASYTENLDYIPGNFFHLNLVPAVLTTAGIWAVNQQIGAHCIRLSLILKFKN